MRKSLAWLIVVVMLFGIGSIPVYAETGKETVKADSSGGADKAFSKDALDKIIRIVKAKINVPSNYQQFSSEVNNYDGKSVCRLRWYSDSSGLASEGGNLEVTADEQGTVQNYYHYKYNRNYEYKRRLPRVEKDKAAEAARKFTSLMAPDILEQVSFDEKTASCSIDYDGNYRFYFYRQYKSILFYDNNISVLVNGETGEVTEYARNWSDKAVFPEPEKLIGVKNAEGAYKNNIGLVLKYRRTYGEKTERTYLEYSPRTSDLNYSIDAFSGEKVMENNKYDLYNDLGYKYDQYRRDYEQTAKKISEGGKELDGLVKKQGLITVEEAEKLARGMEELGIDASHALNSYSYSEYGETIGEYRLRMDFAERLSEKDIGEDLPEEKLKIMIAAGEFGRTASVTFNAKTSELVSFDSYGRYGSDKGKEPVKRDELKKKAEDFLAAYKAEKFKQSRLLDSTGYNDNYIAKYNGNYGSPSTFIYARDVGGISFEDNQMAVSFDEATGKISRYSENWDDMDFIPVKDAIGAGRAYEVLFRENPLQLRYTTALPGGEIKLVYGFSASRPICVDGEKGLLISYYNAKLYTESSVLRYRDIEKHSAKKQIEALAEIGMLPEAENFNPDKAITQKDWLLMIGKARGVYYSDMGANISSQKDLDAFYRLMINEGILEEKEKDPDAEVSCENAVKYLLNAIGYKKFAELEGVFACSFADKDEISPKLLGYAVIAKALKLVDVKNGYFMPEKIITRAEAAVILYNYMKS